MTPPIYEYSAITIAHPENNPTETAQTLTAVGSKGWRLCDTVAVGTVATLFIFERKKGNWQWPVPTQTKHSR